jgi:O-antigen/teichoic acid export membrane protein
VLSVLAGGVFVGAVEVFARSARVRDAVVLFAVVLPALALNLRWMVLGVRSAKAVAVGNVTARAVLALGILVFVHGSPDLHRVPFLELSAELCYAAVISVAVARHFGLARPRVDVAAWIATLRESLPLLVNAFARAAFYSFDVIAIELFLGPHEVGLYAAAAKPVLFCTGAIGLFSIAFLSSFSAASPEEARALLRRSLRTSFALCLAIAALLSAVAVVAVPLVFGDAYRGAVAALAVLAWRIPAMALSSPLGSALIAAGRQTVLMRNNLVGALALVGGDLVAVPLAGIVGAAVVGVLASILVLGLNYRAERALSPLPRHP